MKHFSPTDEANNPANAQYNNMREPPASLMATGFLGARRGALAPPWPLSGSTGCSHS